MEIPQKATTPPPVVSVRQFGKRYRKNQWAIRGVDLDLQAGEIFGLIGPDGAGKSSLMKAISGIMSYEEGEITVFGQPLHTEAQAEAIKNRLGFMPQGLGLNLYPELSIEENIDFFAKLREVSSQDLAQRKQQLLAMTQLAPFKDRPMKHLSGGMKQKLGLVCTLIHQPDLIILDEPTTGVDPVSRREFWQILNQLVQDEGVTALVSTAYMDEASRFHRLSVFNQGQILHQGTLDQILQQTPGQVAEITFENAHQQNAQLHSLIEKLQTHPEYPALHGNTWLERLGDQLQIISFHSTLAQSTDSFRQGLQALAPTLFSEHEIQIRPATLEEAFIYWLNPPATPIASLGAMLEKFQQNAKIPSPDAEKPAQSPPFIEAKQLTRRFGDFTAVDHLSFAIQPGEIFGLLGANGAGKSTAIKMLTGILPPSEGYGQVAGIDMRQSRIDIRQQIGYMSQAFSLYLDLTVTENLTLFGQIYGLSGKHLRARIDWALDTGRLHTVKDQLASALPMGKRQRLALGCALLHQPKVLFLDEPTSGVDPIGRQHFWQTLMALRQEMEIALLVTTHYMSEAEHCHRIALMQAGKIIQQGAPAALKKSLRQQLGQVLSLSVDRPFIALQTLQQAGWQNASLFGNQVHLFTPHPDQTYQQVVPLLQKAQVTLKAHWIVNPSLEDVFIHTLQSPHKERLP